MQGTCKWDANGSNGSAHFYFDIRLFFSRRGHVEPAPAPAVSSSWATHRCALTREAFTEKLQKAMLCCFWILDSWFPPICNAPELYSGGARFNSESRDVSFKHQNVRQQGSFIGIVISNWLSEFRKVCVITVCFLWSRLYICRTRWIVCIHFTETMNEA